MDLRRRKISCRKTNRLALVRVRTWHHRLFACWMQLICATFLASPTWAAEAVISNRTTSEQSFIITTNQGANGTAKHTDYKLIQGDLAVVHLERGETAILSPGNSQQPLTAAMALGKEPHASVGFDKPSYQIQPDAVYYLGELPSGKIALGRIGIGEMPPANAAAEAKRPLPSKASADAEEAARTITVKILVDEEEPSKRALWERRLRDRVAAASDILERYSGMKLKVVAVDTWQSDNNINNFEDAVSEFIRKVDPGEARLAIGFTSQFQITKGRTHLGGTRGPLARHILLREWSQYVTEPERLELLVHEVGHFLGAVHSPESDSVMRVILGDKQARVKRFQIHYDPLNTLAINLVADEWQQHPLRSIWDVSADTKDRLRVIYEAINQSLPDDPAAAHYLNIMEQTRQQGVGIGAH